MAIYRLLRNTALGETGHLIAAYELTLRALDGVDRNDPLTTMIARKVLGGVDSKDSLLGRKSDSKLLLGRQSWV